MRAALFLCFLLLTLLHLPSLADLSFDRKAKNFPAIGLAFPPLFRAAGEPFPPPAAHTYLPVSLRDTLSREDRFDPLSLWFIHQACGRWRDPDGRTLLIGKITHKPPTEQTHITREMFTLSLAQRDTRLDTENEENLSLWVATFSGQTVYAPEKRKGNDFALESLLRYPCDTPSTLIYAFHPRRAGSGKNPDWYCAVLQGLPGEDPALLQEKMEENFIKEIRLSPKGSSKTDVTQNEINVDGKQNQARFPFHPIREEARKSVENYDDWWIAETEGYVILSDVYSETGKGLIRQIQKELPALFQTAKTILPPFVLLQNEVAVIRLFQRREDYVRYMGEEYVWSGGVWSPSRRELVLYQKAGVEEMMPVIRHEAFHQYLSYAYGMLQASAWINEGFATLFESGWIGPKGTMLLGDDERRERILIENLDWAVAMLPLLLAMPYDLFYEGSAQEKELKYILAWGLCTFLQKGIPESALPETFSEILPLYAKTLALTRNSAEATLHAFQPLEMETFQTAFRTYWQTPRD